MNGSAGEVVRYVAAGGVVVGAGRVLVLERPGRNELRLPKGHVEHGESAEAAPFERSARRQVVSVRRRRNSSPAGLLWRKLSSV